MNKEEIFGELKEILIDSFMVEEEDISLSSNLFTDLDFDSIDAIDLAAKVHAKTGKQLNPEQFKEVQTIEDVIDIVLKLSNEEK